MQAPVHDDHDTSRPRAVRTSAVYDLIVACAFATPWTARLVLDGVRALHSALGLPGQAPPLFGTTQLLFVTFFGAVVTMWAVVRLLRDDPVLGAADSVGRAVFALLMTYALAHGVSPLLAVFLVAEVGFLAVQTAELTRRTARQGTRFLPAETP